MELACSWQPSWECLSAAASLGPASADPALLMAKSLCSVRKQAILSGRGSVAVTFGFGSVAFWSSAFAG